MFERSCVDTIVERISEENNPLMPVVVDLVKPERALWLDRHLPSWIWSSSL